MKKLTTPSKGFTNIWVSLFLLLSLGSCAKDKDKFVGTWHSDTYPSSLVITKASENNYIVSVKYGGRKTLDREVSAVYNEPTKSLDFKLRRVNPVNVEYEDYDVKMIYIEDENKLFGDDKNFGRMSKTSE